MPARVEIRGTAEFRATAAKLKAAGRGDLVREMAREMRTAARPVVQDAQRSVQSLASRAVRGGGGQARRAYDVSRSRRATDRVQDRAFRRRGLRATIARAVRTQVSTGARSASVRIRTNRSMLPPDQRKLPRLMNKGAWRHPVMGNRDRWVEQKVTPEGWFDKPMLRGGPQVRRAAVSVVDDIVKKLAE
ncbi:hypothetical protein [Goodfellowiella coeruleoviolacea]|uniref:Uncharacterized protein n=1 Tax=Goodfellowiella coeruleoviolacea TaxID=334858 RepID=A0AAE3GIT5_9PSEU|nr:hypothetical protein [Goodfellowiella coeruleoviolacea]MCP2168134.1 hypothetical protein [Goodfellowiella coeruleoviolacea]